MKRSVSQTLLAIVMMLAATTLGVNTYGELVDGLVAYWNLDGELEDGAHGLDGSSSLVDDELQISDVSAFESGVLSFTDEEAMFGLAVDMSGGEVDGHLFANSSVDMLGVAGEGGYLDGNMSVSVWANAREFNAGWQAILAHGEQEGFPTSPPWRWQHGSLGLRVAVATPPRGQLKSAPEQAGTNYAATVEGGTVSRLYVDGVLDAERDPGTPVDQGTNVHIGMNPETSGREWNGQIDDVAMWNRPLTATEISEIYLKGLTGSSLLETPTNEPWLSMPLPGVAGSAGQWGIREITNNGVIDSIQAANTSAAGGGTITEGSASILDFADPDTNPNGGPIIGPAPNPILSDSAGDDDNITTVALGRINVTEAGDYTFQVNASNGFGLRIVDTAFDSTAGGGINDPADDTTLARLSPGTAFGTVNLDAGEYDVEVLTWSETGDTYFELTSAQGVHTAANTAQWLPVGDSTRLEEEDCLPDNPLDRRCDRIQHSRRDRRRRCRRC